MNKTNGNIAFCIPLSDLDEPIKSSMRAQKFGQVQEWNEETETFDDVANPTNAQWIADAQRKGKIVKSPNVKTCNGQDFFVIPFDLSLINNEIEDWKADGAGLAAPRFFIGSIEESKNGVSSGKHAFSWDEIE